MLTSVSLSELVKAVRVLLQCEVLCSLFMVFESWLTVLLLFEMVLWVDLSV